jgi:phosphoenolpyruvate carboxykinase (GTP)
VPRYEDLDWRGLEGFTPERFEELTAISAEQWKRELLLHEELFVELLDRLPSELMSVRNLVLSGLWRLRGVRDAEHPTVGS